MDAGDRHLKVVISYGKIMKRKLKP